MLLDPEVDPKADPEVDPRADPEADPEEYSEDPELKLSVSGVVVGSRSMTQGLWASDILYNLK